MRNSRRFVWPVAGTCIIVVAHSAGAQVPHDDAIVDCQHAIVREVGRARPGAVTVRLGAKPLVAHKSRRVMSVQGAGQYVDRDQREWRAFTFACRYHSSAAEPHVSLRWPLGQ
jgi:hypothetical protein